MPGIIAIHHGGKYIPDETGVDTGASPSTTLGGDFESCITPAKASTLVQVERIALTAILQTPIEEGKMQYGFL